LYLIRCHDASEYINPTKSTSMAMIIKSIFCHQVLFVSQLHADLAACFSDAPGFFAMSFLVGLVLDFFVCAIVVMHLFVSVSYHSIIAVFIKMVHLMCFMEQTVSLKISMVIPAYNEEATLEGCLAAIFAQEHPFDEVIVVDNNSTDNTVEIAKKFNVTLIHEPRQGVVYARDTGFDAATGDIIGRIDADTLIEPNWTKQLLETFSDEEITAVTGPVYYHDMPARATGQKADTFIRSSIDKISNKSKFLFGSNMAIRRSAWSVMRDVVCREKAYHEDLDLAIHLVDYDYSIFFDKKLIAGVSSRRIESSPADFRKYMKMYSTTYKSHGIREASVTIPIIVYWSVYPSMKLLRGAYSPETGRISLEKLLLKASEARSNPMGD
jgi:glycosyltransferase involved in cell wall biosynthesis